MNQHQIQRAQSISSLLPNVVCKLGSVKSIATKIFTYSLGLFICASFMLGAPTAANAEDANAKAIVNSTELLNFLGAVDPDGLPHILENIQNGQVRRVAQNYPVWIIDSDKGTLLYYQGQKSFQGQSASRLVDDTGFRFGQRALDMAKNSRSTWVKLSLAGKEYKAYCASKAPFVVCSLVQ
ncbi:hypothetical protein [Burkholderia ubonensis]|uniref:hypothetical protein n=1 Tax=Burkholderia ubonensis TaxID=101571 RepID=UPI000A43B904|nr:hypothetical protein [Burkholderia ubonensis]